MEFVLDANEAENQCNRFDWINVPFIILFHVGAVAALFSANPVHIVVAFVLYVLTGLGITIGYHRLLTHRSFVTPLWCERLWAILGTLALQNGPITWVAIHRQHHKESDTAQDPHNIKQGFFHAHLFWMLRRPVSEAEKARNLRFAPDLMKDPFYRWLETYQIVPTLLLGAVLLVAGGWPMLLWGLCLRLIALYHATWLVNSAAHKWGQRPFPKATGTNNFWVALVAFGEGWHNNHHAFPSSARHGLKWRQFDLSWMVIRAMSFLGLVRNIKKASI